LFGNNSPAARIGFLVTTVDSEGEFPNRFVNNFGEFGTSMYRFLRGLAPQVDSKWFILLALAYEANGTSFAIVYQLFTHITVVKATFD